MSPTWLYGALALAVALQAVAVLLGLWVRRRRERTRDGDRSEAAVACPDCGAENEPGYRFCRRCVAELPGARPTTPAGGPPATRGLV
ncbi:DUF7577 domain-containing protein [Halostella salina]|uniref:DUF7577 domain-containing protein n=1 Tax=Halostella salina TaxID=1547897 RepID=UPI000EF76E83|nr:zinc-ribbon domain-containing protein [Halostella salina]